MANVSSSNGLEKRPKLRFPGFDEPWKAEKLSDFAERVTRKNTNNETSLPLTISSKDGLVDQISYFNKTVASKDMSGYYLLKNGEYAYNKSYSVGYDFGSVKRLDRYDMGALSTLYISRLGRKTASSAAFSASSSFRFSLSSVIQPLRFLISCRMDCIRLLAALISRFRFPMLV